MNPDRRSVHQWTNVSTDSETKVRRLMPARESSTKSAHNPMVIALQAYGFFAASAFGKNVICELDAATNACEAKPPFRFLTSEVVPAKLASTVIGKFQYRGAFV